MADDMRTAVQALQTELHRLTQEVDRLGQEVATLRDGTPSSRARSVLSHADMTFGGLADAERWMAKPHPKLDGNTPLDAALASAEGKDAALGLLVP